MSFTHLHVHSHYSLLNALPKTDDLVAEAKKMGMKALALTDTGNMYGVIDFYMTCKKKDIKPIIGVDFYVAIRTRKDMQAGIDNRRTRLVLLAKNFEGYQNLIKLVTTSNLDGFYYKPRIDRELMEVHSKGLICIAPSFSGDISQAIKNRDIEKAKEKIAWYKKVYGAENFYLEITRHPEIETHEPLMQQVLKLAEETNTQIVAAHDVYYLHPEDKAARDTLMLVNTSGDFSDKASVGGTTGSSNMGGGEESVDDFSFISPERAAELFKDLPEALANTEKIANECNLELTLGKWYFPKFIVESGLTHDEELKRIAYAGFERRKMEKTPEAIARVDYELKVIKDKGYAQYFLVVSDLLRYAHENKILTNIRGSVAGSLVTYLSYITNVDPIEYKLPFERFLNPERPSAPDIDMDFADNRRDEVIEYARKKYGYENVAQIGTFGTMMARGSVRDVARAMGYAYEIGDKISKLIPMGAQGFPMTIDRALKDVAELKELYERDNDSHRIIDMAQKIEGCARHISVHAAGVVIAPSPLTDYVPLQYDTKGEKKIITQYDMYSVGEDGVGLLKFDFLGIRNLSILADAVERVRKVAGLEIDIENVPLDDKKTFEILARGETTGLFQLNGTGMTKFLVDLKPSSIHDINAMVALYRPGPLEMIPTYIERKHDPAKIEYLDPRLKDILDRSYGVITYQDDVMMIAIKLAGYSWLEADKLRKAMGKKIPKEMEEQKEKLLKGFEKGGVKKRDANKLWELIEPFAAYGFNKCVTGDTIVTDTSSGSRLTVEELYKTNRVINIHSLSDNQKLVSVPITVIMENGVKETHELVTRSGRRIKATANHPLLTFSGWRNLGDLKEGEKIAVPRSIKINTDEKLIPSSFRAVTLGYLLSEGNLCHPHGMYYYSTSENEIEDFVGSATQFNNVACTLDRSKSAVSVYCGQKNQRVGNSIVEWIEKLGLRGKKATEKFIPEEVFTWSLNEQAIFLAKLWQGDGCISVQNEQIYYATSSSRLAHDVQHLLLRFEILSTIHTKQFKYRGGYKIGYTVNVSHRNNLNAFAEIAGKYLISPKKESLRLLVGNSRGMHEIAARGTTDIIPAEILSFIRDEMKARNISIKKICQETGLHERLFSKDSKKIGYHRPVIAKIAEFLGSETLKTWAYSDIYWDEVKSIKYCGLAMTYDLTVPPYHNFIANDMVVHNSHAASYGKVAYQTAYMKANYPAIYMSAVLSAESGDVEKIAEIVAECKRMRIPILPPDINESYSQFTVIKGENGEPDRIRFGLVTIKNFGQGIATAIIDERKRGGRYLSLSNFLDRVKDRNLNKKSLEALVKAGALDSFGVERGMLLGNIETLLAYNKEQEKQSADQSSLFMGMTDKSSLPVLRLGEVPPIDPKEKLAWEKELLGLYISGHPLDRYREIIEKRDTNIKKAKMLKDGELTTIACIIEEVKPIATKKGDAMAFLKLSDFSGTLEAVVFPRTLTEFRAAFVIDKCIAVKGKISERNGEKSMIVEKVMILA